MVSLDSTPIDFEYSFAIEYVKDFNGTRALQRTGHTGNDGVLASQASRLLRNVKVQEYIRDLLRTRVMGADEVLSRISDTARLDLSPYLIKKRNKHYINIDAIKADGLGHLIKELSYDAKGNQIVKFDDRQSALINIGKQHGLFSDKVELKLTKEIDAILDTLESNLDADTYQRVLQALSAGNDNGPTSASPAE